MTLSYAQSILVEEYLHLAATTARRFARRRQHDYEELRSECLLALSRAVLTYRPGTRSLRSYVILCCRRACIDYIKSRRPTEPLSVDVTERVDRHHEQVAERLEATKLLVLSPEENETLFDWLDGKTTVETGALRNLHRHTIAHRRDALADRIREGVSA